MLLYFVETDAAAARPADLADYGLAHILDGSDPLASVRAEGATPGGESGLLLANKSRLGGAPFDIDLDAQVWSDPLPGFPGTVRVGWWRDHEPTPASLARSKPAAGYTVTDASGRDWHLPVVRKFVDGESVAAVPQYLTFDDNGNVVSGEPLEQYVPLFEGSEEPFERLRHRFDAVLDSSFEGDGGEPITDGEVLRWLSPLVAANYVVTAPELVVMRCFDDVDDGALRWLALSIGLSSWVRSRLATAG